MQPELKCPHCSAVLEHLATTCPRCAAPISHRGADLAGRDLGRAELEGADLRDARLSGASLVGARLVRADLRGAALDGADLTDADLTEADLGGADLGAANLCGAVLHRVNVAGANLHRTVVDPEYACVLRKFEGTPAWDHTPRSRLSSAPARYAGADDGVIKCPRCGGELFVARDVLLNTRGLTFLGFDWLNDSACTLTCARCSHIEWFARAPQPRPAG